MTHDRGAAADNDWARLDAPAVTPRRFEPARASALPPLRLRRSRSQVLAALDGGGTLLQRKARDVLVGSSLLLIPLVGLNLWMTRVAFERDGATRLTAFGGDDVGTGIEVVATVLVVVFASLAGAIVGLFAAIVLISDRFGTDVRVIPALGQTLRKLPAVVLAWALGHVWVPFFATWTLSSRSDQTVGRLVLTLPVAAVLSTFVLFVVPIVVAERAGPLTALRRSIKLARLRFGATVGFLLTATLVGSLLLTGFALFPALLQTTGFITFGQFEWLAQGIASQLGVIVVVPLIALGTAQLYLELRLDAEGMDISLDADAAFGAHETGTPT